MVNDLYGNRVDFHNLVVTNSSPAPPTLDVSQMLCVKDSHLVPDKTYQEFVLESNDCMKKFVDFHGIPDPRKYPSLFAIRNKVIDINKQFSVQHMANRKEVHEKKEIKLNRV